MHPLISLKAVCQLATIGVWPSNRSKEHGIYYESKLSRVEVCSTCINLCEVKVDLKK